MLVTRVLARVSRLATKLGRRAVARTRGPRRRLAGRVRRLPLPQSLRRALYRYLPWRPWTTLVPTDRLLLGGQNGLTAAEFAERTDDLAWASTPVTRGPHAQLLRDAAERDLTDDQILSSEYGRFARSVIAATGNYFHARSDQDVVRVARDFIDDSMSRSQPETGGDDTGRSAPGSHIRVARIRHSECYQVVDGHHRVAALAVGGAPEVRVRTGWLPVTTPLQDLLDQMSWVGGQRELYQPVDAPELTPEWTVVRRCVDRLDKMDAFLETLDGSRPRSFLDVASCYGWFVRGMADLGLDARGVERDPLARELGVAVYGLGRDQVEIAEAVTFLRGTPETWDVVSCLSLLHHFALGRGEVDEREFVRLLDRVTGRVLFLDTGQSHEEWLRRRLPGWETEDVASFLKRETTFDRIVDLGPDQDAVAPYDHNYGRHLFACVRS